MMLFAKSFKFFPFPGGLTAVIYTDTFQAALMLIGAAALTAKGKQ